MEESRVKREYLGDGLYVRDLGWTIELSAPRLEGTHWVGLEDSVLSNFLRFLARSRKLEITIRNGDYVETIS